MVHEGYRILVENEESAWNDETGVRYHFPKSRYLNRLKTGMKFIYYKGRTKGSSPSYFGYGEISSIYPDPTSATEYYADISKYIQFNESVDFKPGGEYIEEVRTSNHFRQNSVREISAERFYRILELGGLNLVKSSNEDAPIAVTELPPIAEVNITLASASLLKTAKAKVKGDQQGSSSLGYGNPKKAFLHGNQGEYLVMKYLRSTLSEAEAGSLRHHAVENEKEGYDISYTDLNGDPIYIEVKATSAPSFPSFIITINELTAAIKHGKAYKIYLVNKVTSKDVGIEIIEDIAGLLEAGEFVKNAVAFKLEKTSFIV